MNAEYHGIYAALVTPYTSEGKVDYKELQKLVNYLIEKGPGWNFMSMEVLQKHFYFQKRNEITLLKRLSRPNAGRKKK